jgi:hypothetical protein
MIDYIKRLVPNLQLLGNSRRRKPLKPAGVVRTAGFDENLELKKPKHWLVRIAWSLFYPRSTRDYIASQGRLTLEAMDWWLGSAGIFLLSWLTIWKNIKIDGVDVLAWLAISLAIYLILWLLTGWMGASSAGFGHFLASTILGVVSSVMIYGLILRMDQLAIALNILFHRMGIYGASPWEFIFSKSSFTQNYLTNITRICLMGILAAYAMQIRSVKSTRFISFTLIFLGFGAALWSANPAWGDSIAKTLALVFGLLIIIMIGLRTMSPVRWVFLGFALLIFYTKRNPEFEIQLVKLISPILRWLEAQ